MQYIDLVRDCIDIFQLPPLPPNEVETAHAFDGMMNRSYAYADYDAKQHWDDVKSELYSAEAHEEAKAKRRKRRAIAVGEAEGGDDPDDDAHDYEIEDARGEAENSGLLMESAIQVRKKSDSQGDERTALARSPGWELDSDTFNLVDGHAGPAQSPTWEFDADLLNLMD